MFVNKNWYAIVLLMSCFFGGTSYADLIKYTDNNGTLCFVDDLGKVPKKYIKNIIREEEEGATQVVTSRDVPLQQSSNNGEVVHICYAVAQSDYLQVAGRDVTDFLEARGYPYVFHLATDLVSAKSCFEFWCKWDVTVRYPGRDFDACIESLRKKANPVDRYKASEIFPFIAIGTKIYTTNVNYRQKLDEYFHVDYYTPIVWKD